MKEFLYIIVDVSGSMKEMGKIHLQRNLCRYTAQLQRINQKKYSNFDFYFYRWTQKISKITLQSDGDMPALHTEGFSSLTVLSDFLLETLNNIERLKVVILSDGNFNRDEYKEFIELKNKQKNLIMRTVAVGADADLLKLKKISTTETVYLSENIASAIDGTIFGSDEPLTEPVSTPQVLQSAPAESEEPEEDRDA